LKTFCTYALLLGLFIVAGCVPGAAPTKLVFQNGQGSAGGFDRPRSLAAFKETVYPILRNNTCVNCHNSSTKSQSPMFADGNIDKAFDALTLSKKVDFVTPESSRIVGKVRNESHNCWTADCAANANEMLAAIKEWIRRAPPSSNITGIATGIALLPPDSAYQPAQTEHGVLILQRPTQTPMLPETSPSTARSLIPVRSSTPLI
jgi:hypothetical protein